jgi:Asp-tRNA(Asn)/Glu-tRNA(Gln) amidotransferase A subunit family amidase
MTAGAEDLVHTPATVLAERIRSSELSPVELMDAVLERVHAVEPSLHAFITLDEEGARRGARDAEKAVTDGADLGPLHGIPVSVKDLFATAGLRTTSGSKLFEHHVPSVDAVAVERLRAAGAIVFGKTNTPSFGHKDMSDNLVAEATRNPWDTTRTAGGSSGGAAAAVASGMGPIALGSDGAGSIRIPAALCGVYGIKPSAGRVPFWPNRDFWGARSHIGPLSRTVRDAASMLSVMAGPDRRDPLSIDAPPDDYLAACAGDLTGLRVAWSPDLGLESVGLDPEVRAATEAAARRFGDLGCSVEEVDPGWADPSDWHRTLFRADIVGGLGALERAHPEWIDDSLAQILEAGRDITMTQLVRAQGRRSSFYDQARAFMDGYDILLTPAMTSGAWPVDGRPGDIGGHAVQAVPGGRWPLMFPFNALGWPAASVPCGFTSEGLPIGLQIVTPWHTDARCLAASAAFEAAQPWVAATPDLGPGAPAS